MRCSVVSPDSPKPISPNLEKVHSMSKMQLFCGKNRTPMSSITLFFSPNFLLL